jgi:hypothetical protein
MTGKFIISKKPERRLNLTPSPISGVVPPVEHRFQPGVSGNPGGTPKVLTTSLKRRLNEEVQTRDGKRKVVDLVVDALVDNARSALPHSVTAFREIARLIEPDGAENNSQGPLNISMEVLRSVYERAARMTDEKLIDADELPPE